MSVFRTPKFSYATGFRLKKSLRPPKKMIFASGHSENKALWNIPEVGVNLAFRRRYSA